MSFHVDSEVGKLRRVLVHGPGLEHDRLTPSNAADLLFDDVIWVKRAREEHQVFCDAMRERGVEVLEVKDMLAETLAVPEARDWLLDRVLDERQVGVYLARTRREWAESAPTKDVAEYLIGGLTKEDVTEGEGLTYDSNSATDMLLPPLPNFIFQRDCSAWIYDGVTLNPMAKRPAAARPPSCRRSIAGTRPSSPRAISTSGTATSSRTGDGRRSRAAT